MYIADYAFQDDVDLITEGGGSEIEIEDLFHYDMKVAATLTPEWIKSLKDNIEFQYECITNEKSNGKWEEPIVQGDKHQKTIWANRTYSLIINDHRVAVLIIHKINPDN